MRSAGKILLYSLFSLSFIACDQLKQDFDDWYASYQDGEEAEVGNRGSGSAKEVNTYEADFYSTDLLIDRQYRSMQGPYEVKSVQVDAENSDLIWIVGYDTKVLQAESKVELANMKYERRF